MNKLDREYAKAQRKYLSAVIRRDKNVNKIHREFVLIAARVLKRNMRKAA